MTYPVPAGLRANFVGLLESELRNLAEPRRVSFGYIWWFLTNRPWYVEDARTGISRRQWNLFWRHVEDGGRMVYRDTNPYYDLSEYSFWRPPADLPHQVSTITSPNVASLLVRMGWAEADQFSERQKTCWPGRHLPRGPVPHALEPPPS